MDGEQVRNRISRREFLKLGGGAVGAALLAGCAPRGGAPAVVNQVGDADLSRSEKVGEALEKEGAKCVIHTWGFSGLPETHIIPRFAEYTKERYGVEVQLEWASGSFGDYMQELPLAGKHIRDVGIDVMDKEEEYFARIMALDWGEPVDLEEYRPLLDNVWDVEDPYIFRAEPEVDGGDIYGVIYQGYEWLQAILRKDKVDAGGYTDWTDLAQDEMIGKGINYAFNDSRGHFVFMGFLNSLVKQGTIQGDLWSEDTWEAGIEWWAEHMDDKVQKWGDIGNDPTMRLMLQTGEAWWAGLWGVYTRELLGTDWNRRDDVLHAFYPKSGIAADRMTMTPVKGAAHPVAARILINWFVSTEFQHVGWYKETPDAEAQNRWGITEDKYLVVYAGGVSPKHRELMPDWAIPYHPVDPGSLIFEVDWEWYTPKAEWISKTYDRIVRGV